LFFGKREQRAIGDWFITDTLPAQLNGVSPERAMMLAPMYAAHRHIVDYLSTLPVDTYRKAGDLRVETALPPLLSTPDAPGGEGLVAWLGKAAFGLALGNAVGYVRRASGYGMPTDVHWLHWSQWSYTESTGQWYINGQPVASADIVHIPWIVPPGRRLGMSPLQLFASTVVQSGMSAQEYADIKRGGGLPPVVIKNTQKTLDPTTSQAVKDRAKASFAKGEPWVTGADWDLQAITIPPNQAAFVETLKLTANQIASIYGIDPTEVGGTPANSLTYSTEELRQINRAANMRPYIERLERGLSRLMPEKQFMRLNVDATMRVDLKTRTEVVGAKLADGRLSLNEARALEDDGPVPGGDFHNVPTPKSGEPNTREGVTHD
jgi:HK97 family phage portal protein